MKSSIDRPEGRAELFVMPLASMKYICSLFFPVGSVSRHFSLFFFMLAVSVRRRNALQFQKKSVRR